MKLIASQLFLSVKMARPTKCSPQQTNSAFCGCFCCFAFYGFVSEPWSCDAGWPMVLLGSTARVRVQVGRKISTFLPWTDIFPNVAFLRSFHWFWFFIIPKVRTIFIQKKGDRRGRVDFFVCPGTLWKPWVETSTFQKTKAKNEWTKTLRSPTLDYPFFLGGIKPDAKCTVILRDFSLMVHCLGWCHITTPWLLGTRHNHFIQCNFVIIQNRGPP